MRNLKRALSLLLSSTMVLGMLVMGGSAESYKDVDRADNQEAIEVLQAVGIMTGDENGNFNPDKTVTRNEMAVIMSQLLNLDYDYYRGTNPFTDVPDWAAPYVAACAAEGVVAGIGNGLYGGNNTVTAAQASLMIMKALGYFQNAEDFGSDWQVATIRQASYIDLFDGINANAETALTRNQIAQLVLNGLKSDMVYFTGDMGIQIGDVTVGYKGEYTVRTSSDKKYNTLVGGTTDIVASDKYTIQLGEELYNGKLTERSATDAFERPATTWRYDNSDIGTYADEPDASYTAGVKIGTIYNDLGLTKGIADEDTTVYEDGRLVDGLTHDAWTKLDIVKGQTAKIGGNGALTEVYYNDEDHTATIIVTNTYVGKVAGVYAETTTKDAYVTLNTSAGDNFTSPTGASGFSFETEGFAKDDIVAYTYSYKAGENCIQSMEATEKVTGAMSTYTTTGSVTVAGTKYDANTVSATNIAAFSGTVDKGSDVTVYLDAYGYGLYVDANVSAQYAVVLNYTATAGDFNTTPKAELLFTDGTTKTVEVDLAANCGTPNFDGTQDNANLSKYDIVSYSVDSDEVYSLTLVADAGNSTVTSAKIVENGKNTVNLYTGGIDYANIFTAPYTTTDDVDGKTIFLVADTSKVATGGKVTYSVYEGFANVPTITNGAAGNGLVAVYAKDGNNDAAEVVFIERTANMTISSGNKDIIYVKGNASHTGAPNYDGRSYSTQYGDFYEYDAFINGEATTIKSESVINADTLIYGPHYNTKGVLNGSDMSIDITDADGMSSDLRVGYGTDSVTNDVIKLGLAGGNTELTNTLSAYAYEKDVNVYYVTVDGELVQTTINSIARDFNDRVYYKVNDDGRLTDVYVKVVDEAETVTPGTDYNMSNQIVRKGGVSGNAFVVEFTSASALDSTFQVTVTVTKKDAAEGDALVGTKTVAAVGGTAQVLDTTIVIPANGNYVASISVANASGEVVATGSTATTFVAK